MPDIKHQFTGGKMNKDLDERLVPNGQYRDALNVQVSTSDSSEVGTVQNILGNSLIPGQDFIVNNATCIGSIADEKNDKLYYFITENSGLGEGVLNYNFNDGGTDWVVDAQTWSFGGGKLEANGSSGSVARKSHSGGELVTGQSYKITYTISEYVQGGVRIVLWGNSNKFGNGSYTYKAGTFRETIYIDPANGANATDQIEFQGTSGFTGSIDNVSIAPVNDIIVEYDSVTKDIVPVLVDKLGGVLGFYNDNIITGINIIDNLLLWTDNINEPKKINIDRSKAGTNIDGLTHTNLIVNGLQEGQIQEEHITVIKKSPSKAPGLEFSANERAGYVSGRLNSGNWFYSNIGTPDYAIQEGEEMWVGFKNQGGTSSPYTVGIRPNIEVGDVIRVYRTYTVPEDKSDFIARLLIVETGSSGTLNVAQASNNYSTNTSTNRINWGYQSGFKVSVSAIIDHDPITSGGSVVNSGANYSWELEQEDIKLFERKFPRFAYRYKYEDNEYSSIGPFSDVVFIPGDFDYHPTEAYNKGMINRLTELTLKDFVTEDIPKDAVQIDLLYKDEVSPSIYVIKSINKDDSDYWNVIALGGSAISTGTRGVYPVGTESIYAQIPANQLLRPWDNVPRLALAQEVTGNRVVYANYIQNFDMLSEEGSKLSPELNSYLHNRANNTKKSIKSQRTYNFGVLYGDKYGRETPVFTSNTASQMVSKPLCGDSTGITVEVNTDPPLDADYYKLFVKETSNEYYNLAVGRIYNAEDNNLWISFPSVDRNKVDDDTYLVLKKGVGEEGGAVLEDARYKIVAIENEAPDYIKTNYTLIAEPTRILDAFTLFGGASQLVNHPAELPLPGHRSFTIDTQKWTTPIGEDTWALGLPDLEEIFENKRDSEIYVSFSNVEFIVGDGISFADSLVRMSDRYKVTGIVTEVNATGGGTGFNAQDRFRVSIDKIIPASDAWYTDYCSTGDSNSNYTSGGRLRPHFYRKEIENKPEFDGRFFVKIISDNVINQYLEEEVVSIADYQVSASIEQLYYLSDDGSVTGDDTTGADGGNNDNASTTYDQWSENIGTGSKWFIDATSIAGHHSLNGQNPFLSTQVFPKQDSVDLSDISTGYYYWNDNDISSGQQGYVGTLIAWGNGMSTGAAFLKGVHAGTYNNLTDLETDGGYDASGTQKYLHLSFSGIAPDISTEPSYSQFSNPGHPSFWGTNGDFPGASKNWGVGDGTNASTEGESSIISQLSPQSLFRISGDDNIYKITKATKRRVYNYRGWIKGGRDAEQYNEVRLNNWQTGASGYQVADAASANEAISGITGDWFGDGYSTGGGYNANDTNSYSQWCSITDPKNCRISYLVEYTTLSESENISISDSSDIHDLSENSGIFNANGAPVIGQETSVKLEFIEEFKTTEENKLTRFPAIFETEPKDDVGLDIYYEATGKLPVRANEETIKNLVNIGATLSITPASIQSSNLSSAFVTSISFPQTSAGQDVWEIEMSVEIDTDELEGVSGSGNTPILIFNNDDGSFVTGEYVSAGSSTNSFLVELNTSKIGLGWFNCWSFGNGVESNRIGDTYNKPFITNGVKASTTLLDNYEKEHRKYGLIYSGIYNSTSGTNNLNQFIQAEKITKDVNPTYGSIQKLYSRSTADGDLITICEDRVLKILANKDALYNADGNPQLIANDRVLGQTIPFSGEYGISKNPESFASQSYRVYFTDKVRGSVMRLSRDGLTPISNYGMKDWFRDNLKLSTKLIGSYDDRNDEYNITLADREALGEELIVNGRFNNDSSSWTLGTGWTYAYGSRSGKMEGDSVVVNGKINQSNLPINKFIVGREYEISFTVSNYVQGKLEVNLYNENGDGIAILGFVPENTTYTFRNKIGSSTTANDLLWSRFYIQRAGNAGFTGNIDNISVKEIISDPTTVSFKEEVKGWVSFKSFTPENALSMAANYYSMLGAKLYQHNIEQVDRNNFYGIANNSSLRFLINDSPDIVKTFHTLNYEGSQSRVLGVGGVQITGIEYHSNSQPDGKYFYFYTAEMDELLGNSNWSSTVVNVNQYRPPSSFASSSPWNEDVPVILFRETTSGALPPSGGPGKSLGRRNDGSSTPTWLVGDVLTTELREKLDSVNYSDSTPKDGWFASDIVTNKQEGSILEFVEKEGKWFNHVKGVNSSLNHETDFGAFDVQGIGVLAADPTIIDLTQETPPGGYKELLLFNNINASLQNGDIIYFQTPTPNITSMFIDPNTISQYGVVTDIPQEFPNSSSIAVIPTDNSVAPVAGDYILFAKNHSINTSTLVGYYASVKFENNSIDKAELFSVGSQVSESSK